jgi:hypothetical protein
MMERVTRRKMVSRIWIVLALSLLAQLWITDAANEDAPFNFEPSGKSAAVLIAAPLNSNARSAVTSH